MGKVELFIAKAVKNPDGTYSVGETEEIQSFFRGAFYNAIEGIEAYGKPKVYIESYAEASSTDVYYPPEIIYEENDLSLKLYFFDLDNHEDVSDAIKAIDNSYHAFVDYISGGYVKLWDSIRQRKVMLSYQSPTTPDKDTLFGIIYKSVTFKFKNVFGRSFSLDDDIF